MLRARDFHKKERAIKTLRRKAEERNPDEFYFAMERSRTKDGVHIATTAEANAYTQDELRLMKTQDVGYLTMKTQSERAKVERAKQSLHQLGGSRQTDGSNNNNSRRHTVFVDSDDDVGAFDAAEHFETPSELMGRAYNRPRASQLASGSVLVGGVGEGETMRRVAERVGRQSKRAYEELAWREERQGALNRAREFLEGQKKAMAGGRKVKVSGHGATGKVFRWKSERKR